MLWLWAGQSRRTTSSTLIIYTDDIKRLPLWHTCTARSPLTAQHKCALVMVKFKCALTTCRRGLAAAWVNGLKLLLHLMCIFFPPDMNAHNDETPAPLMQVVSVSFRDAYETVAKKKKSCLTWAWTAAFELQLDAVINVWGVKTEF